MTVHPHDPVVVDLARLVWILAQRTGGTITVTEDEMRSIPDRHQVAITGFAAEPPDTTLAVRVAPLPPCPACNDDGETDWCDEHGVPWHALRDDWTTQPWAFHTWLGQNWPTGDEQ